MSKEKIYYRTPQLQDGTGSFRCHNCSKVLARKVAGSIYEVEFECPRCHAIITVKCREPIPSNEVALGASEREA